VKWWRSALEFCAVPFGTRLINLILPGTDVPGSRLFRPCGTGFVAVSKSLRTSQQTPEKTLLQVDRSSQGLLNPDLVEHVRPDY
jgi:hypothetical protein